MSQRPAARGMASHPSWTFSTGSFLFRRGEAVIVYSRGPAPGGKRPETAMPSLKPGFEIEPASPVPLSFRPPESVIHRVSDGEDWYSVAKRYNLPVDYLVYSNFQTNVPREINWYLREYIRCDLPTADRKNWRFSTSARMGGGPRPGVVYVTLNWNAILQAAKTATRLFVTTWFQTASLGPSATQVFGPMLTAFPTSVQVTVGSDSSLLGLFERMLIDAGAPDELARNWPLVLFNGLLVFTQTLETIQANAFPTLSGLGPFIEPVIAAPFPLLLSGNDNLLKLQQFLTILTLSNIDGTAAQRAMQSYASWFSTSFTVFRQSTVAMNVRALLMGGSIPGAMAQGLAIGHKGFLLGPGMTL